MSEFFSSLSYYLFNIKEKDIRFTYPCKSSMLNFIPFDLQEEYWMHFLNEKKNRKMHKCKGIEKNVKSEWKCKILKLNWYINAIVREIKKHTVCCIKPARISAVFIWTFFSYHLIVYNFVATNEKLRVVNHN